MFYSKRLNIAGKWWNVESVIEREEDPTASTAANVGQLCYNSVTHQFFKCISADNELGVYEWEPFLAGQFEEGSSFTGDTALMVMQTEDGRVIPRLIPFSNLAGDLVADVEYDEEAETLYLINSRGSQIGNGTRMRASLHGLEIRAEDDYDEDGNIVQYVALYDQDGVLISRDEVNINISAVTAGDTVKLVNTTRVNGNVTNILNTVWGNEDGVTLTFNFYIYDAQGELVFDNGTARITINGAVVGYSTITQGANQVTYYSGQGGQLTTGDNTIVIKVTDSNGNSRSLTYNVTVVNLTLASNFNAASPFEQANLASGTVPFTYIPYGGDISKTVHFELDGNEIDTVVTKKYNTEMSYPLSGLSHGNHVLRVWMTATVNNEAIVSNVLRYDFLYIRTNGSGIAMAVDYPEESEVTQGDILTMPYLIYASGAPECNLYYRIQFERANADTGSLEWATYHTSPTYTVDRTRHSITIKDYPFGNVRIQFFGSTSGSSGSNYGTPLRTFLLTVAASDLALTISEVGLGLWMDTAGRSNAETADTVGVWRDTAGGVTAQLTGFDFTTNGWKDDGEGSTALKVSGGAEVTIPYYPFGISPIATGASGVTIELDFMTDEVSDGEAVLLSCMSGGIGFEVLAEEVIFSTSAQRMSTPIEPGKRIRIAFVVEAPGSADKLVHMYINGVDGSGSGIKAYAEGSEIIQQNEPIRASSDGAAIWIYGIRVYTMAKDRRDTAMNYIASLPTIADQAAEYNLNQIFDANSGAVTANALRASNPDLTVVMLSGVKMPTAKVDSSGSVSKTDAVVSGQIIDSDPNLCITFEDQKIAIQGTSSAAYYRKNYKQTIKACHLTSDPSQEFEGYTLRTDALPAKKLCFKKDVASSEQANNVLLARLYNDACPYQSDPQKIDPRVRQGIDGKPCVIFFTCTDPDSPDYNDGQPVFFGKYNMNIDKGSENVFGFDMEDENGDPLFPRAQSWEFRNNTSPRCLFQISDFATVKNGKLDWLNDFEARYPEDSTDSTDFAALCSWIASTNPANKTGEKLSEKYYVPAGHLMANAVLYKTHAGENGEVVTETVEDISGRERKVVESTRFVTETIQVDGEDVTVMPVDSAGNELYYHEYDTANYREEVFYQEFSHHFDVSDAAFYYAFTEFFLMVDNRAKNMFVTSYDGVKWMFLPYDFDTANGINNEGELAFSYGLEATDTVSGAYVFNDHMQSVLWTNFMNTFGNEIAAMVKNLDSAGWIDPDFLVGYFLGHQNTWPVTLWNHDENWTYSPTLTQSHDYLKMWQGKKEVQREWWIRRRHIYIGSKYLTESALADVIEMRVYTPDATADGLAQEVRAQIAASLEAVPANSDMEITTYQDAYINTKWGSYEGRARAVKDVPVLMETPEGAGRVNDTETYVYSASSIRDLGDLSGLYVGRINVSNAVHLESLVLGSSDPDYANLNCNNVTVGRNTALRRIDVRGLVNLTGTLALVNCPNITDVYAERTKLAAVTTPNGGCLRTLHLPATITSLSLCNQENIEDFSCGGFANLQSLRVENCPALESSLKTILAEAVRLTHVRLIDVNWEEDSADRLVALTQLGGLDENGATTSTAVVTGHVNIKNCSADDLTRIKRAFPYLNVTYSTATARLTFVNGVNDEGEGGDVLFTLDVPYGGTGYYPYDVNHNEIPKPTLVSSARYSYEFDSWSGSITNVTASRTITAVYTPTVRKYTVEWQNNAGTVLRTDENVPHNTVVEWGSTAPAYSGSDTDMVFAGWTFTNTNDEEENTVMATEALTGVVIGKTTAKADFVKLAVPSEPTAFSSCTWGQIIALIAAAYDGTLETKTGYATLEAYGWTVGDETTITLKSGETVVLKIWGFNINEDQQGNKMPVTIGNKYSLLDTRQMNAAARYLFGYTVSDTAGDTSVTNERTREDYTAYENEKTALPGLTTLTFNVGGAGTAEITFTERTWLSSIAVTVGGKTFNYYFDGARSVENAAYRKDSNYFAQEDCSAFTARAGVVMHTGQTTFGYTDAGGTESPVLTVDGSKGAVKVFDRYMSTGDNNGYRAIEFMPGAKISIPFTGAGKIVIAARAVWNNGGHICSTLRAWLTSAFIDQLPAIIQQRLVPVKRKTMIGGLDWGEDGAEDGYDTYYDKVFLPTYRELGFGTAAGQPYCNETNVPFPTFSSNEMRLIACYRGGDQELLSYVWSSSPHSYYVSNFIIIYRASGSYSIGYAGSSYGVLPGFCLR